MTDEKKPDDKERKKISDEEMKDVAGGSGDHHSTRSNTTSVDRDGRRSAEEKRGAEDR